MCHIDEFVKSLNESFVSVWCERWSDCEKKRFVFQEKTRAFEKKKKRDEIENKFQNFKSYVIKNRNLIEIFFFFFQLTSVNLEQ